MSKQGYVTLFFGAFENVIFGIFQMLSNPLSDNASILSWLHEPFSFSLNQMQ